MFSYFDLIDTKGLDEKLERDEFPSSKNLFSYNNYNDLNNSLNQKQIIETILTVGLLTDFYVLNKIYSKTEIVSAIKNSAVLDKKTGNFCSIYFKIPKE